MAASSFSHESDARPPSYRSGVRLGPAALRGAIADEAERAIDAMLAGPLPEAVTRSVVRHRVLHRVVEAALDEQDGDPFELAVERFMATPAFKRALHDALSSPEVRTALAAQTAGFGSELAGSLRAHAAVADARIGTAAARASSAGGPASRGIALVVDALLAQVGFLVLAASVSLVAWLAGASSAGWVGALLAGCGWLVVSAAYFAGFWSAVGQTPGMRLLGLRVAAGPGRPGVARSLVRFAGLILSILTFGLGFVPALFDGRRRALPDYLAGTEVVG